MTKAVKKKNRRLKRSVRKSLGAIFMASAIAVAAIPVENLRADTPASGIEVGVDIKNCHIPLVNESSPIYTTGDGRFQFTYTESSTVGDRNAVILGYGGGRLEDGVLTIPNKVDAYRKYPVNSEKEYGYCAVSRDGDYLFYEDITDKTDEFGEVIMEDDLTKPILDDDGNETGKYEQKPVQEKTTRPCYYEYYQKWGNLEPDKLLYEDGTTVENGVTVPKYTFATIPSKQRQPATVFCIGNQRLVEGTGAAKGTWSIVPESMGGLIDTPEEGVMRGEISGNITTLYVGADLSGIGDYAFYGCTNLTSIKLENGLDTLGNYAFADCVNLEKVDIDVAAKLSTIGHHAFNNCRALRDFVMPRQVSTVGDSTFEGCKSMTKIDLCGQGKNVQLHKLGKNIFRNCESLIELVLPDSFEQDNIDVSMFEGCIKLLHITAQNSSTNFKEGANPAFGFDAFKATVPASFYFEGVKNAPLHQTATSQSMAFKYLNEDVYEITITHKGLNAVYQVNSANKLIRCDIPSGMEEVQIPGMIGPYQIQTIDSTSFQGSCSLKKISIPSSIKTIEANAFMGCHNLKTVIFNEPVNIQTIGENAFQTQLVQGEHRTGCSGTLAQSPVLQFVGPISYECVPFAYAMDPESKINVGSQYRTYITYFGSWPENLQVRYNENTDRNELINYMTFKELRDISSMTRNEALEKYPCMTEKNVDDYLTAVRNALDKTGTNPVNTNPLTDYEREILNATVDILLPVGIESIQEGLFAKKELEDVTYGLNKRVTANNLFEVAPEAFAGCTSLKEVSILGGTKKIGDHAFQGCTNLEVVNICPAVDEMGVRPFAGCSKLTHVNFQSSSHFSCVNSIIFGLDAEGHKKRIVEFLEGRTNGTVRPEEVAGVSEMAEEAFMGTDASNVDLRDTTIETIPKKAFADTKRLYSVFLPFTWRTIDEEAFANSSLQYLEIPGRDGSIDNSAFNNHDDNLYFYCEEDSMARRYAEQNNIKYTDMEIVRYYTVNFWDADNNLLETQTVKGGEDAIPPEAPEREGYILSGWVPDYHAISRDMEIVAQYVAEDPDAHKLTVTFLDYDGTVIDTQKVAYGEDAVPPIDPVREGYAFVGWVPSIENVTTDIQPVAQYEAKDNRFQVRFIDYDGITVINTQLVDPNGDAIPPKDPVREGYVFKGWIPVPTNITHDLDTYAQYETDRESVINKQFVVTFYDYDGTTVLNKQTVNGGEDAILPKDPVRKGYIFKGWLPSPTKISQNLDTFAQYERDEQDIIGKHYTVNFYDYDGTTLLDTQEVAEGKDAILPKDPVREGYTFKGWLPSPTKVMQDMNTYAQYERNNGDGNQDKLYTVYFYDYDGTTLLHTTQVKEGENAVLPSNPVREGYTFMGWVPSPVNVTSDMNVYARYEKKDTGKEDEPNGDGSTPGDNRPGDDNTNTTLYTLTVQNGSGSGSYVAGSQPIIIAADPAAGMEFANWTIDPADTKIASRVLTATVITMPEANVTVTANYKLKSGTSSSNTSTGSGNSSSTSSNNSGGSGGTGNNYWQNNNGGGSSNNNNGNIGSTGGTTTVVIDKNGLSNTSVVSAAVNGSSDNFVIKITESADANELAVRALLSEYGDITNIKYFPMDISLYDSTGNTKITDTSGLKITITLPLPDSLITYAGNNKVASVSSGKLEKLSPKFTTISGVACVTFTAEHFSPYVIYVNTNNLTAGTIIDNTPKTGDGVHPKWFLSIGLACISLVLFMKKDRREPIPVKVRVKA